MEEGGLLNIRHFERQLKLFETLNEKGKKTVIWGAGHNEVDPSKFGSVKGYNVDTAKFGLVGTRDFSISANWVPCVSCLNPIFNNNYVEEQDVGIICGSKSAKNKTLINKLKNYPVTSNTTNLEEMISFIGRTNKVVTDSYHAMYWAILMGKKTAVIPTTSKFYDFKYPTVITTFDTFEDDIKKSQSYTGVLEECREINLNFAQRVFEYLEIS